MQLNLVLLYFCNRKCVCVCVWYKKGRTVIVYCKYLILITILVNLGKWSRVASLALSFFLRCFSAGGRLQSDEDTFYSLFVFFSFLTIPVRHISPLYSSCARFLSEPAVRDNYFQTSGLLGEPVLSKAAFIKNSRSCVDVFALRWKKEVRHRKRKKNREQWQSYTRGDLVVVSWMRLANKNNKIKQDKKKEVKSC